MNSCKKSSFIQDKHRETIGRMLLVSFKITDLLLYLVFPHLYRDKTIAWLAAVIYCHRVRPLRNSENFRTNFQNYLTFESLFNDDDVIARIIFQRRTVLQQYSQMLQNDLLVYSNMNTIWMTKGSLGPTLTVLYFLLFLAPEANR